MRLIEIILAIVCIIAAIYNFDLHNFNQCVVSVLLFATAILTLSKNKKLNRFVRNFAVGLAIFLILKLITVG